MAELLREMDKAGVDLRTKETAYELLKKINSLLAREAFENKYKIKKLEETIADAQISLALAKERDPQLWDAYNKTSGELDDVKEQLERAEKIYEESLINHSPKRARCEDVTVTL